MRRIVVLLAAVVWHASAQDAVKPPAFEVTSVRLSNPSDKASAAQPRFWGEDGGRVRLNHIPLGYLIQQVYKLRADQISGPSWLNDEFFDISATVSHSATKDQIPLMFESLLKERFGLVYRRETNTAKTLVLVVGKDGSKLRAPLPDEANVDLDRPVASGARGAPNRSVTTYMKTQFGLVKWTKANGVNRLEYYSMPMEGLVAFLNQPPQVLGGPVVDETGLKGQFQMTLDLPADLGVRAGNADEASDPVGSILESLHKMGLDVARREVRVEKFVVEHIEKTPTPN